MKDSYWFSILECKPPRSNRSLCLFSAWLPPSLRVLASKALLSPRPTTTSLKSTSRPILSRLDTILSWTAELCMPIHYLWWLILAAEETVALTKAARNLAHTKRVTAASNLESTARNPAQRSQAAHQEDTLPSQADHAAISTADLSDAGEIAEVGITSEEEDGETTPAVSEEDHGAARRDVIPRSQAAPRDPTALTALAARVTLRNLALRRDLALTKRDLVQERDHAHSAEAPERLWRSSRSSVAVVHASEDEWFHNEEKLCYFKWLQLRGFMELNSIKSEKWSATKYHSCLHWESKKNLS